TTYYYKIRAYDGVYSSFSNIASSTTVALPSAPTAPSGLPPTASTTELEIAINWADNSTDETSFVIERSSVSSTTGFAFLTAVAANATSTYDPALAPGTTYWYRIFAVNGNGTSTASNVVSETSATGTFLPTIMDSLPLSVHTAAAVTSESINYTV